MSRKVSFALIALKNLFSKPATSKYPFAPANYPERSRGHIELEAENCILCGNCDRRCPTGCIKVDRAGGSWSIDRFDCIQCSNCVANCPKKCLHIVPGYHPPGTEKITESHHVEIPAPPPKPAAPAAAPKPAESAAPAEPAK